jgi:hypothetical protein
MIIAAYYLEQAADKRVSEIESIPIDEEVREADEKAENLKSCYRNVTQWSSLPWFAKWYLRISLACIVTCSYMVQLFSSHCFTPFSLTDSIDDKLNGNAANLFLPLGWVAVILFMLSCLFLFLFQLRGRVSNDEAYAIFRFRESVSAYFTSCHLCSLNSSEKHVC